MPEDVEMNDTPAPAPAPAATAVADAPASAPAPSTLQHLKEIALVVEAGSLTKEVRRISRAVRLTVALRRRLAARDVAAFLAFALAPSSEAFTRLSPLLPKEDGSEMDVDAAALAAQVSIKHGLPEIEIYCYLLVLIFLIDHKKYDEAKACANASIARLKNINRRTVDVLASRLYSYYSYAHELTNSLAEIRGTLLGLHRMATLHRDELGQETLLNLLLRNYLHYNLYDQAEKLRSKAPRFEAHSNQQFCRYLFYLGKIRTIQLEYTDAKESLLQAARKAPTAARGFRIQCNKWAIIVRLLLGEIPERTVFMQKGMKAALTPYFELTNINNWKKGHCTWHRSEVDAGPSTKSCELGRLFQKFTVPFPSLPPLSDPAPPPQALLLSQIRPRRGPMPPPPPPPPATNGAKLTPNLAMDAEGTRLLNLTVLQRLDPAVEDILITAAHVTLYDFNIDLNQWSRKDVEGSLFVVKRNTQPRFQFIVMNRRNTDNLVEDLLSDFEYELQPPYLLYRNAAQEVNGIWFYNQHDCDAVANLFGRILNAYARVPPKAKVPPTKSEFEELEAVPTSAAIDGPLEPPPASNLISDTPDESLANYFGGAASIGSVSSAPMVGRGYPPSDSVGSSHVPMIISSAAPTHQIPLPLEASSAPPLPLQDNNAHASHSTNLVTPAFFAPPSSSAASLAPLASSMLPTAPPLHPTLSSAQHSQYGHGTPLLQPFPPPAPPPSFAPAHNNEGPVISRDKVKDALLRLVQSDQFIDLVYRELQNAHM